MCNVHQLHLRQTVTLLWSSTRTKVWMRAHNETRCIRNRKLYLRWSEHLYTYTHIVCVCFIEGKCCVSTVCAFSLYGKSDGMTERITIKRGTTIYFSSYSQSIRSLFIDEVSQLNHIRSVDSRLSSIDNACD